MDDIRAYAKKLLQSWSKDYNPAWPDGVLYTRYSPGGKQNEQSIEGQIRVCKEFTEKNHINVVDIFIDTFITGTNDKRVDFQRMLSLSRSASWSFVIVYDIERFGRNKEEIVLNRKNLRENKKIVLSATQVNSWNVDGTRNLSGIIMESVHEGMAEYYPVELSMKIKRGHRENLEKKLFLGGIIPYGYKSVVHAIIGKKVEKKLVIDDDEAEIVKLIYSLYAEGKIIEEIRTYLNEKGLLNQYGRQFVKNQIIFILQSEKYLGTYIFGSKRFENYHPAIIDKEIFMKAQERFKRNKINAGGGKAVVPYLLTTRLFCGECDRNMVGESGTSGTGRQLYHYYICHSKKNKKGCTMPAVPKDIIEEFVVVKTVERIFAQNDMKAFAHELYLANKNDESSLAKINILQQELNDIKKSISNIMKAIEEGVFTASTKSRLLDLEAEKERLESAVAYERLALEKELPEEKILFFLEKMSKGDVTSFDYKARIIETFIEKVFLFRDKVVICYKFTDDGGKLDIDRRDLDEYIKRFDKKRETLNESPCSLEADEKFVLLRHGGANRTVYELFVSKNYFGLIVPFDYILNKTKNKPN